jgi:hypothetical protein
MPTMINRQGTSYNSGSIVIHNAANGTYVVVGNSTVSNIASGPEVVVSAAIAQAWWGVSNGGYATIKRGSNTVAVFTESGYTDYAGAGASLKLDGTATVVITFTNAPDGYVMMELQKLTSNQSDY